MRVADQQLYGLMSGNLSRLRRDMLGTQTEIATGKRINQPSDDPIGFGQSLSMKSSLSAIEQRLRNIQFGETRVNAADAALGEVSTVLSRIKQLAVQARSDTSEPIGRTAIATEIRQLQQQLVTLGNTQVSGQYIFAGTNTDQPAFVAGPGDSVTYQGNDEVQAVLVGDGETVQVALPGNQVFTGPDVDLFASIKNLISGIETNDGDAIEAGIGNLETSIAQSAAAHGHIGALQNRLSGSAQSLEAFRDNVRTALSETEDADLARTLTEFSQQQVAFQAVAETTSRIFESTLLNFLR